MAVSLTDLTSAFPGMSVHGMYGTRDANGTDHFVYASWLQKAIRRGLTKQAIFAAAGIFAFGIQEKGAQILSFLYNRLVIIAIEDIGIANPFMVDAVVLFVRGLKKEDLSIADFFGTVGMVTAMCESPKSRLCSWIKNACARDDVASDLGPYREKVYRQGDVFKMTPAEIKSMRIGSDGTVLSSWLYESGQTSRKEWIFGLILVLVRDKEEDW